MREYIDVTGKTEEEAVSKALEKLGMDRDDVSVEILERAKSGFLGLGSSPAKVRISYGPEETPAAQQPHAAPAREHSPEAKPEKKPVKKAERPAAPAAAETLAPARTKEEKAFVPADNGEEVDDEKAQAI